MVREPEALRGGADLVAHGYRELERHRANQLFDLDAAGPCVRRADRRHAVAQRAQRRLGGMAQIDREHRLSWDHGGRVGFDVQPPNGELHDVRFVVQRFRQRLDHCGRGKQGILTVAALRRAGVRFLAGDTDAEGALALDSRHHADA